MKTREEVLLNQKKNESGSVNSNAPLTKPRDAASDPEYMSLQRQYDEAISKHKWLEIPAIEKAMKTREEHLIRAEKLETDPEYAEIKKQFEKAQELKQWSDVAILEQKMKIRALTVYDSEYISLKRQYDDAISNRNWQGIPAIELAMRNRELELQKISDSESKRSGPPPANNSKRAAPPPASSSITASPFPTFSPPPASAKSATPSLQAVKAAALKWRKSMDSSLAAAKSKYSTLKGKSKAKAKATLGAEMKEMEREIKELREAEGDE